MGCGRVLPTPFHRHLLQTKASRVIKARLVNFPPRDVVCRCMTDFQSRCMNKHGLNDGGPLVANPEDWC